MMENQLENHVGNERETEVYMGGGSRCYVQNSGDFMEAGVRYG